MILLALCQKVTTHESGNVGYFSPAASGSALLSPGALQDRPIPVLDEATAFADPENEAALIKALAAAMRGRTVIMVAHRLSMVTQADVILLFSDGQLRKWEPYATVGAGRPVSTALATLSAGAALGAGWNTGRGGGK